MLHPRPPTPPQQTNPPGDGAARSIASRSRRPGAHGSGSQPLAPSGRSSRSRRAACRVTDGSPSPGRDPTIAQALVKQCAPVAAPRGHRGGLVSEVAVPGRTAHEGKPASHDTSVPSPPHPPEGAGTLGRYPCGARSTINGASHRRRRPEPFAISTDAVNDPHRPDGDRPNSRRAAATTTGHKPLWPHGQRRHRDHCRLPL